MSYYTQHEMSSDPHLQARITACAATERVSNPERWAHDNRHTLAASPAWADAYVYAQNTGNEQPGRDETVITDGMILAAVQALHTKPVTVTPQEVVRLTDRLATVEHQQTMASHAHATTLARLTVLESVGPGPAPSKALVTRKETPNGIQPIN